MIFETAHHSNADFFRTRPINNNNLLKPTHVKVFYENILFVTTTKDIKNISTIVTKKGVKVYDTRPLWMFEKHQLFQRISRTNVVNIHSISGIDSILTHVWCGDEYRLNVSRHFRSQVAQAIESHL